MEDHHHIKSVIENAYCAGLPFLKTSNFGCLVEAGIKQIEEIFTESFIGLSYATVLNKRIASIVLIDINKFVHYI